MLALMLATVTVKINTQLLQSNIMLPVVEGLSCESLNILAMS